MPEHLSPLIKALVGTDYSSDEDDYVNQRYGHPKKSSTGPLSEEIKRIEEIQKNAHDQSVAIIAAAAAAAVWSEGKQGPVSFSLRMKSYNEEWEDALR